MTAPHPSLDTLADYCARLLSSGDADEVATHLGQCTACAAQADAVRQVPAVLAAAASGAPPMPEAVWRDVEEALRREGDLRGTAPASLTGRRTAKPFPSWRRPIWSLAAAAAAVVAVAGGIEVVHRLGGSDSAADSAATRAHHPGGNPHVVAAGGAAPPPSAASKRQQFDKQLSQRQLSPRNLPGYAAQLAAAPTTSPAFNTSRLSRRCASPESSPSEIVTVSRWEGARAVVIVNPAAQRVQVLDCSTASVLLYSTSY